MDGNRMDGRSGRRAQTAFAPSRPRADLLGGINQRDVLPVGPPTDVGLTDDAVIVVIDAAGLRDGGWYEMQLDGRALHLSGYRPSLEHTPDCQLSQLETWSGPWRRTLQLPAPVTIEGATAMYDKGVLRIQLPRSRS